MREGFRGVNYRAVLLMRNANRARRAMVAPFAMLAFVLAVPAGALELRVATWNLEHLDDTNGAGCAGRSDGDYAALARRIDALGADIIAFQEVENTAAAGRVFDAQRWSAEVSSRPSTGYGFACRGRPEGRFGHLATGIAIREGLEYTRNADFSSLAGGNRFLRWGTDVTVQRDGQALRVLSVHLKSGCWGAREDGRASRESDCGTLRDQMEALADWIANRRKAGEAFVVVGDFNRRLAVPGDWAWAVLTDSAPALSLPTAGRISRCDERYPEFIDHLVFDAGAGLSMVLGSFEEGERSGPHPDHCAVSARFRIAPAFVTAPFLVAASNTPPFGFLRVENRSDEPGSVEIIAIDDTGERFGPVSLALEAGAVSSFTSRHLEDGSAQHGLLTGVGDGDGHWRLELETELDIAVQAFARNPTDYISRIDATVAGTYAAGVHRYEVAFLNPGSNPVKRSILRLINPADYEAEVTITAVDDDGAAAPGGDVTLTLAAGEARDVSVQTLESGAEDFEGSLGDGEGKWRLSVSANRALHVLNFVRSPSGYLVNL